MNAPEKRLETALFYLKHGWNVWDFCCDHGELGKSALSSHKFASIHFVDRVPHIIEKIRASTCSHPSAFTHLCDLTRENLSPSGNLLFFGIGAKSMITMLNQQCPVAKETVRLILCPNKNPEHVRTYLARQGWKIINDTLIRDKKSLKEVIVCELLGEPITLFGNHIQTHMDYKEYIHARYTYYRSLPEKHSGRDLFLPILTSIQQKVLL